MSRGRFRRSEVRSQRRAGQQVDQGPCPHVDPGDGLPCLDCLLGGEE